MTCWFTASNYADYFPLNCLAHTKLFISSSAIFIAWQHITRGLLTSNRIGYCVCMRNLLMMQYNFFIIHKLLLLSLTENYHLPSCQLKYNLIISIINLQKWFHSFQEIKIYKNWSKTQTYLWTEMVFLSQLSNATSRAMHWAKLWKSLLMTVCLFVCLLLTLIFKSARIPWTTSDFFSPQTHRKHSDLNIYSNL